MNYDNELVDSKLLCEMKPYIEYCSDGSCQIAPKCEFDKNFGGCSTDKCGTGVINRYKPLILPYYYEYYNSDNVYPGDFILNVEKYDLFCILSQFSNKLPSSLTANYDFDEMNGVVHVTVKMFDDKLNLYYLSDEEFAYYTQIIDDIVKNHNGYCILFSTKNTVEIGKIVIPKVWANGILPFLRFSDKYPTYYSNGNLYIKLDSKGEYSEDFQYLHEKCINVLEKMYYDGVVLVNEVTHAEIIQKWNLVPLDNIEYVCKLYRPLWKNTMFAGNLNRFIRERIEGNKEIIIKIGNNHVLRNLIAREILNIVKFNFSRCCLHAEIDNFPDAERLSVVVSNIISNANGEILVIGNYNELEDAKKVYGDMLKQFNDENHSVSIYSTLDNGWDLYTVSVVKM